MSAMVTNANAAVAARLGGNQISYAVAPKPATAAVHQSVSGSVASLRTSQRVSAVAASRFNVNKSSRTSVVAQAAVGDSSKRSTVAVLGASGGIGQPLSMLLSMNPMIKELRLYDIRGTPGVAADLSHMNEPCTVKGFEGADELESALTGCDLVVIPAGVPRKPGMTRDDLFDINAGIVRDLAGGVAKYCPNAFVNIISNPVNSTVPIASEVFKEAGIDNANKLFGVTTLDVVRACKFVNEKKPEVNLDSLYVTVLGGHAGITILPILSKVEKDYGISFTDEEREALTVRIQNAGTEVVEAKAGAGSATLSMAYAAARFANSCLLALQGQKVSECSYVKCDVCPGLDFFATKVDIGPGGVEKKEDIVGLNVSESEGLEKLKDELKASITKGKEFAAKKAKAA